MLEGRCHPTSYGLDATKSWCFDVCVEDGAICHVSVIEVVVAVKTPEVRLPVDLQRVLECVVGVSNTGLGGLGIAVNVLHFTFRFSNGEDSSGHSIVSERPNKKSLEWLCARELNVKLSL